MSKLTEQLRRLLMVPSPQLEALAAREASRPAAAASRPSSLEEASGAVAAPAPPKIAVISCMLDVPSWRLEAPSPVGGAPDADSTGDTALLPAGFAAGPALPFGDPRRHPIVPTPEAEPSFAPLAARVKDAGDQTAIPLAVPRREVLPFARLAAPPAAQDLDAYARLCAEAVHASRSGAPLPAVFARHGFHGLRALAALHEAWAARFRADGATRTEWERLRDQHLSLIGCLQEGDAPCPSMCN
ncbi:MAG: hypothetical protein WKG00_27780 [Polyangiaceae bacterium]